MIIYIIYDYCIFIIFLPCIFDGSKFVCFQKIGKHTDWKELVWRYRHMFQFPCFTQPCVCIQQILDFCPFNLSSQRFIGLGKGDNNAQMKWDQVSTKSEIISRAESNCLVYRYILSFLVAQRSTAGHCFPTTSLQCLQTWAQRLFELVLQFLLLCSRWPPAELWFKPSLQHGLHFSSLSLRSLLSSVAHLLLLGY